MSIGSVRKTTTFYSFLFCTRYYIFCVISLTEDKEFNKDNYEIIAFRNNKLGADDLTTERLKGIFHEWYDIVKVNDLDVVNLIRDKKINILFDLTGYSTGNRCEIFKNKSAPLQISWCGYCNSSGLKEMDYLIADENFTKAKEYTKLILDSRRSEFLMNFRDSI